MTISFMFSPDVIFVLLFVLLRTFKHNFFSFTSYLQQNKYYSHTILMCADVKQNYSNLNILFFIK